MSYKIESIDDQKGVINIRLEFDQAEEISTAGSYDKIKV